jgi:hypothetical protein
VCERIEALISSVDEGLISRRGSRAGSQRRHSWRRLERLVREGWALPRSRSTPPPAEHKLSRSTQPLSTRSGRAGALPPSRSAQPPC